MHSSKGNQQKWENNGIWYKADHTGYEGLAEYILRADTVYGPEVKERVQTILFEQMRRYACLFA